MRMTLGVVAFTAACAAGADRASTPATLPVTRPAERVSAPEEWRPVDAEMDDLFRRRDDLRTNISGLVAAWGEKATAVARRRQELAQVERSIELRAGDLAEQAVLRQGRKEPRDPASLPPPTGNLRAANRIVFVVDCRRETINLTSRLRPLVKSVVRGLTDDGQSFEVLCFYGDEGGRTRVVSLSPAGPVVASRQSKQAAAINFEDVPTRGHADAIVALRAAFERQPDTIVFIACPSHDADAEAGRLVEELARLNPGDKVRINTLAVSTELAPELRFALRRIARVTGGTCRSLTAEQLDNVAGPPP